MGNGYLKPRLLNSDRNERFVVNLLHLWEKRLFHLLYWKICRPGSFFEKGKRRHFSFWLSGP